ncbi:MAG: hypothetical protein QXH97_00240 [Candidatus Bathyarchaeia archaeon]
MSQNEGGVAVPLPKTAVTEPIDQATAAELTEATNTLIATVVKIVITHDEEECARENKYNRPCETCQAISELKPPVRKIIRLTEKIRKARAAIPAVTPPPTTSRLGLED